MHRAKLDDLIGSAPMHFAKLDHQPAMHIWTVTSTDTYRLCVMGPLEVR